MDLALARAIVLCSSLLSGCACSVPPTAATLLEASCRQAAESAFVASDRIRSIKGTLYFNILDGGIPIAGGCWEGCASLAIDLSSVGRTGGLAVYFSEEMARGAKYRIESSPELSELQSARTEDFWNSTWDEPSEWASEPGWWAIAVADAAQCGTNNWTQGSDHVVFLKYALQGQGFACLRTGPLPPPNGLSSVLTLEQTLEDAALGCDLQELRYSIRDNAATIGQVSEFRLLCNAVAEGFQVERCPASLAVSPVNDLLGPLKAWPEKT